jgi:type IV pilus assembly protein PilE
MRSDAPRVGAGTATPKFAPKRKYSFSCFDLTFVGNSRNICASPNLLNTKMTTPDLFSGHVPAQPPICSARELCARPARARCGGFTAIEVMIVVVIVGILAAIAIPSYQAYVQRGKVSEVTSVLGDGRVQVEQYYNDNLTYVGSPCPSSTKYFTVACTTAATTYTLTATGTADMSTFVYTLNQANLRTTAGPWGSGNCWIFRKGDTC